jgi:uncharacterized protein YjgD (DUF1641 family)
MTLLTTFQLNDVFIEEATKHEKELGLPEGFYNALLKEDDWSFVIKLHALLEASVVRAIKVQPGLEKLEPVIARLEMSGSQTGKVVILKALDILNAEERRFINSLSQLRNELVHNISNVSFKFAEHVGRFDKQQRKSFISTYAFVEDDTTAPKTIESFYNDVKKAIWRSGLYLITALQLGIDIQRFKAEAQDAQLKTLEQSREIRRLEAEKGKLEREANIDYALTLGALLNPGQGGETSGATPATTLL